MRNVKKERWLRIGMIMILACIVGMAFQIQKSRFVSQDHGEMLALPVHLSSGPGDPPQLYLYREAEGKHWLIFYEIDREDGNRFEAKVAEEISGRPEQMARDLGTKGLWVLLDGKWLYYNGRLNVENRNEKYRGEPADDSYPFERDGDYVKIHADGRVLRLREEDGDPIRSLYPLSADDQLWLVLTENDVKVAAPHEGNEGENPVVKDAIR